MSIIYCYNYLSEHITSYDYLSKGVMSIIIICKYDYARVQNVTLY